MGLLVVLDDLYQATPALEFDEVCRGLTGRKEVWITLNENSNHSRYNYSIKFNNFIEKNLNHTLKRKAMVCCQCV